MTDKETARLVEEVLEKWYANGYRPELGDLKILVESAIQAGQQSVIEKVEKYKCPRKDGSWYIPIPKSGWQALKKEVKE